MNNLSEENFNKFISLSKSIGKFASKRLNLDKISISYEEREYQLTQEIKEKMQVR